MRGVHQVYGGLDGDGVVGKAVHAALAAPGATRLELNLWRLPKEDGAYPLSLEVTVGGLPAGTVDVPAPADGEDPAFGIALDVPAAAREAAVVDVLVRASAWVETDGLPEAPGPRLGSFVLRRMALTAE